MMFDKTIHWDPDVRKNQAEMLESLPEGDRELATYMLRTGNVALHYYAELEAEPTNEDFEDWLTGLPDNIASDFRKKGFEKSKGSLPLRRHAAERNDVGMDQYMKANLPEKDYSKWSAIREEI